VFLSPDGNKKNRAKKVEEMFQHAVIYFFESYRKRKITPRLAFISEGPYAVPVKK
jgi:hypothetical protein